MICLRFLLILCLASLSSSCTSFMTGTQTPQVRTLTVAEAPSLVYRQALNTAVAMGTTITQANEPDGLIQGVGTLNVTGINFTNAGTVSPGSPVGQLTVT